MTVLTWPTAIVPASAVWHLQANTSVFTSPLTRHTQTQEFAGARWVCDLVLPPLTENAKRRALTAFLAKMRGMSGRVYVKPWHAGGISAPTYAPGLDVTCDSTTVTGDSSITVDSVYPTTLGTPVINGASQVGATLSTRGWTPMIYVAMAGDYLAYDTATGRTLHMVVADTQSNGAGVAAILVEPPIRTAPADGAALEITNPTCIMRLRDDDSGATTFRPGIVAECSLSLVEAF